MKNKYLEIAAIREPTVRVTRARAAACSSGEVLISDMSKQQPNLRKNSKRAALDERNNLVSVGVRNQHKRRAVLKDVTNVFCNNSSKICSNAVRELKKSSNQAKKGSKIAPCCVGKIQHSPTSETGQKTVMVESQVGEVLWPLDKKAQLEASSKNAEKCCIMDIRRYNATQHLRHSQRFSKKEKENCLYEKKTCWEPEFTDIDSHHKDPQLCSHYASDIYNNLRVAELILKPCFNSMEIVQREITQSMRGILVDWLVEVCEEYKLVPDTLYLTVYLIDLFLSRYYIERQRLQLLGITCLLIASKYEEICAPHVEDFCFITDNTYTKIEVLTMESKVLKDLCFRISAPTAKTFLRRFLRAAQVSYKSPSLELEYLANYLAELTLVDYSFQKFRPSIIAASAVLLARWTLNQSSHPWNPTLEHYSNYKASDLKITVLELQSLQLNSGGCPLNAIRTKYRQEKFKSVAGLPSPKLMETLF